MFNHCSSIYDKVNRYSQIGSYNSRFLQNSSWLADHLSLETTLDVHNGCVNSLCWTKDSGSTGILSGSDDRRLIITDVFTKKELVSVKTNHGDNIFTVRFLPNTGDLKVISGAGDGSVLLSDLSRIDDTQIGVFNCACESGPIYECRPLSMDCSQVFLTCAEDGAVRRYDTRICSGCCQSNRVNPLTRILARISGHNFSGNRQNCCRKYAIVSLRSASTTSIDLAEGRNNFEIAVGCSDGKVRIYDMRNCKKPFANYSYPIMLSRRAALPRNKCQVTCVKYNEAGTELLINFSGNQIHLVNPSCLNGSADSSKSRWMANPPGTTTDETENEHKTQGDNEVRRIKRIRLRGDWTDTGPMARPSRESIIMIRRLSNVFNNLGISPPVSSSSSSNSSSSESENNNSSGESGDQVRLRSFIQSLVGRLSDQANDDEGDHNVDSDLQLSLPHRDRESNVSSEPDYDDDNEDDEDESILNAQFDDLHDINASASVPRHRNRRHPARASAQCSISSENIPVQHIRTFTGHRNSRTIIKECAFYGDRFVLSGSDCGHLFMWDKESGDHVGIFLADQHVVNCVQPHATYPIVATSGIDHNIKIWIPSSKSETEETAVYLDNRKSEWKKILERNEEMLRESQNTLTVLDPLLLGLLASISRARLNRDTSSPSRPDSSTSGGQ